MLEIEIVGAFIASAFILFKSFRTLLVKMSLLKKSIDIQRANILIITGRINYIEKELVEKIDSYNPTLRIDLTSLDDDDTGF